MKANQVKHQPTDSPVLHSLNREISLSEQYIFDLGVEFDAMQHIMMQCNKKSPYTRSNKLRIYI